MKRQLAQFLAACLAIWLMVVYPARLLWGDSAVLFSSVALVLCLLPTLATLAWSQWAFNQSPELQLLAVLAGTGLRMAFVLGMGMLLYFSVPAFHEPGFWLWVLVSYLTTLALEITLVVISRQQTVFKP